MRAKVKATSVVPYKGDNGELIGEDLAFSPVCRSTAYPEDGSDENNTFAKFSPSGSFALSVRNPALLGAIKQGDTFYVDFTKVEEPVSTEVASVS